jgi:hypothetical protein
MSWEKPENWHNQADGSSEAEAWEGTLLYNEWWQFAVDSVFAEDQEIAKQCGAMYLMYLNQQWNEDSLESL